MEKSWNSFLKQLLCLAVNLIAFEQVFLASFCDFQRYYRKDYPPQYRDMGNIPPHDQASSYQVLHNLPVFMINLSLNNTFYIRMELLQNLIVQHFNYLM